MRMVHVVSALVAVGALTLAAVIAAETKRANPGANAAPNAHARSDKHSSADSVFVYVYNRDGKLVGPVESPRVKFTDAEWRKRLTKEQYVVARRKGTEDPFCGTLLDNKKEGVYSCVCCGLPLFSSESKFESGTGWPSFFQPVAMDNVADHKDTKLGMLRVEIVCARCDGHLGHVFDDGPRPTGLRFCLNSESLNFTESAKLASLADPAAENADATTGSSKASSGKTGSVKQASAQGDAQADESKDSKKSDSAKGPQTAVFASGCFWCSEASFQQLKGVSDVVSGYSGGDAATADYRQVSSGITGHAEAIRVTYDPAVITYDQLLDVFFDSHDPTQLNRQGPDVGTQYRSAIFYANPEQRKEAEAKIKSLIDAKKYRKIATTLEPLEAFYEAEDYHQDYANENPDDPYVRRNSLPHARKVREKHADLIAEPVKKQKSKR